MTVKTKTTGDKDLTQEESIGLMEFVNANGGRVIEEVQDCLMFEWPNLEIANAWIDYIKSVNPSFNTVVIE